MICSNNGELFMNLRSPAGDEIALTPALSHRNGRGSFLGSCIALARFAGEGKGEGSRVTPRPYFKE